MNEFTYRSARSGSLVVGFGLATAVEIAVMDVLLHARHPLLAWTLTIASIWTIWWLAADYYALGRGTVRIDSRALDLRVGRRAAVQLPLSLVATVVRPTWRDLPAAGSHASKDYRNLMKPAAPNVLVTLTTPTAVRLFGMTTRPVRRLGLRLDDPIGFVLAVDGARSESQPPAT
ncbi:MAG TPA: hypothetical protein VII52_03270 [Gemmatimonadaceae bacterium]